MNEARFDLKTEQGMVDYVRHVYELCSKKFPLRNTYRIHVRIGYYKDDYRKKKDGTMFQFEDGITFPVPKLLERDPILYTVNEDGTAPPMIVPLRIVPGTASEQQTLSLGILARGAKNAERVSEEKRQKEIRERVFYNCLNKYLIEQGINEDVKVGSEVAEAFTLKDHQSVLRRYLANRAAILIIYAGVGIAMSPLSPFFLTVAVPSVFFGLRIFRKVSRLQRSLRTGAGGRYLLERIKQRMIAAPPGL